jgi:hypothetical protein
MISAVAVISFLPILMALPFLLVLPRVYMYQLLAIFYDQGISRYYSTLQNSKKSVLNITKSVNVTLARFP